MKYELATVTGVLPLTVRIDTQTSDVYVNEDLVGGLVVTDRVEIRMDGTRVTITGKLGGGGGSVAGATIPVGGGIAWYAAADPATVGGVEYMIPDGRAISRTTYATLFSLWGLRFGDGDGTTTFNLPNEKGRVAVGGDWLQVEFDGVGVTGGEKTHTLMVAEMPSHNHTQNAHNHTQDAHNHTQNAHVHDIPWRNNMPSGNSDTGRVELANTAGSVTGVLSTGSATPTNQAATAVNQAATATNQAAGGGAAHNNLQPYIVRNTAIRVK